jgi:hypothetical protein
MLMIVKSLKSIKYTGRVTKMKHIIVRVVGKF